MLLTWPAASRLGAGAIGFVIACNLVFTTPAAAAVTISSARTSNMSCSAGLCAPTAKKAVLNVTDLGRLLAAGNVTVTTSGAGGVQANDINEGAPLNWSSASKLSLDAHRSITVAKAISVASLAAVSLTTNDGGSGGVLSFGENGSLSFSNLSSSLTVNGVSYSLVGTIAALAGAVKANPSGDYAFANSYDASGDGSYSNSPVTTRFTGSFEGLGNTISHLSMNCSKCIDVGGMFSEVDRGGEVASLKVTNLNLKITGSRASTILGGVAGTNSGVLFDVHVSGKLSATRAIGGIAGGNGGSIISSTADVRIRSLNGAGGLAGGNGGLISLSRADGTIQSAGKVGGLVADNDTGSIGESFATVAVTGGDQSSVGGVAGVNEAGGDISNSYATGAVTGGTDAAVGGFVGENDSTVEDAYSTGAVAAGTGSFVGGFDGSGGGFTFAICYWNTTTSGTDQGTGGGNIDGITGLTTQELQSGLPSGFDPNVWAENPNINDGLPYLSNNPPKNKK